MEEALSFPSQDPHGSPIPDRDGQLPEPDGSVPLVELDPGEAGRITRIADAWSEALNYLEERDLVPGVDISLAGREPFDGPLHVVVGSRHIHLGQELARRIRVVRT